jgi:hypothetical protein
VLNSSANALAVSASSATYAVTGCTFVQNLVTVSDVAQGSIMSMTGGKFDWNSNVWKCSKSIHPATQTTDSITIPIRADSVRSVLTAQILSANRELQLNKLSNYERIVNALVSYQYMIGSSFANPTPITYGCESYCELRRIFGTTSSESNTTLLTALDYNGAQPLTALVATTWGTMDFSIADHPSAMIGLCAQPFAQVEKLLSGTSTLANNIYLQLTYSGTIAAVDVLNFVECDSLFSVDANIGTFTVRY